MFSSDSLEFFFALALTKTQLHQLTQRTSNCQDSVVCILNFWNLWWKILDCLFLKSIKSSILKKEMASSSRLQRIQSGEPGKANGVTRIVLGARIRVWNVCTPFTVWLLSAAFVRLACSCLGCCGVSCWPLGLPACRQLLHQTLPVVHPVEIS